MMHPAVGATAAAASRLPGMAAAGPSQAPSLSRTMARPPPHRIPQQNQQLQSQQSQPKPPQSQQFQGTLAPGTRLMIGQIVVTVQKYLSQGGFAHVYLVTTDKPIAMPISTTSAPGSTSSSTRGETLHVLKRMAVPDKEALASVRSEVEVHKSLRLHPNIVHFIEASATALTGGGYEIFILMEYCSGGGIIDLMNSRLRNRLREAEVLKIFGDVAAGLSVMHHMDPPLMHRDLKVENILLAPAPRSNSSVGPTYKLCDFGSTIPILSRRPAKSLEEVKRLEADLNKCTTLQYRAPEMVDVYQRRVIDEKADIWAMGVLLYKLCYYTTPFEENGGGPLAILNAQYRFPPMPAYSQRLKDLIASMLQEQSTARPTIDQVIIGVHRILGTTASASTQHYANLASSGKQMQPLPSIVSSSKTISGSSADIAAMAIAKRKITNDDTPLAAGVNKDLIEMGPSAEEKKKIEEEELRKRSEGIIPMRRGRPNRGTPSANKVEIHSDIGATTVNIRSPSPIKVESIVPTISTSRAPGFSDSFSPPLHADGIDIPSRPGSGMKYSPSLPGMIPSARASPLPPPVTSPLAVPHKSYSADDEATTRFPSVEELDLQYSTSHNKKPTSDIHPSRSRTLSSAATLSTSALSINPSSRNETRPTLIQGLAERSPVSAMAGKFGKINNSNNGIQLETNQTSSVSTRRVTGASNSLLAKRWPPDEGIKSSSVNEDSSRRSTPPVVGTSKEVLSPPLPSRKPYLHRWMQEDKEVKVDNTTMQSKAVPSTDKSALSTVPIEKEIDSSDDDNEVEKPEDVDEPVAIAARKRQSMLKARIEEEKQDYTSNYNATLNIKDSTIAERPTQVAEKADWNRQAAVKNEEEHDQSPSLQPNKVVKIQKDIAASTSPAKEAGEMRDFAVKVPAWDEDDEEMHFLPQPVLHSHHYEQGEALNHTITMQAKRFTDAATSPGPDIRNPNMTASASNKNELTAPNEPTDHLEGRRVRDEYIAPKPIRTQTTKDVGGLVKKYQDLTLTNKIKTESGIDAVESGKNTVQMRKDSLVNGVRSKLSNGPPPSITAQKPIRQTRQDVKSNDGTVSSSKAGLKPWEKEEMEKEQVQKYGSLRSTSPNKNSGLNNSVINPDAQERFSGVSSLISQWQANSKKGAPGWGTVGGDGGSQQSSSSTSIKSSLLDRQKSKEDFDVLRRPGALQSTRPLAGRIPSRDI